MTNILLKKILWIAGLVLFLGLFFPQLNYSTQTHIGPTDGALDDDLQGKGSCATDFFDSKGDGWIHDLEHKEYDCNGSQSEDSDLTKGSVCTNGLKYLITLEVKNYSAGNVCVVCGTQEGTKRNANGVYQQLISANGEDLKIRADEEFVGSVTNIKVRKIDYITELSDHLGGIGISGEETGKGQMITISNLSPGILGNDSIHVLVNPGFLDAALLAYSNSTTVKAGPVSPGFIPQDPPLAHTPIPSSALLLGSGLLGLSLIGFRGRIK